MLAYELAAQPREGQQNSLRRNVLAFLIRTLPIRAVIKPSAWSGPREEPLCDQQYEHNATHLTATLTNGGVLFALNFFVQLQGS